HQRSIYSPHSGRVRISVYVVFHKLISGFHSLNTRDRITEAMIWRITDELSWLMSLFCELEVVVGDIYSTLVGVTLPVSHSPFYMYRIQYRESVIPVDQ